MMVEIALTGLSVDTLPFILERCEAYELVHGERAARLQVWVDRAHYRLEAPPKELLAALKSSFIDPSLPAIRRKYAFQMWAPHATAGDISDLAMLQDAHIFGNMLLQVRADVGDLSIADLLVARLTSQEHDEWWVRFCPTLWGSVSVRLAFEAALDRRIATLPSDEPRDLIVAPDNIDDALSTALNQIEAGETERILLSRWEALAGRALYIQSALAINTPELFACVIAKVLEVRNPSDAFEHVALRTQTSEGRSVALQTLTPFLPLLPIIDLSIVASEANRQSLFTWRAEYVDPLLDDQMRARVGTSDSDFLARYLEHFRREHGLEAWLRGLEYDNMQPERGIRIMRDWYLSSDGPNSEAFRAYCSAVRLYGNRGDTDQLERDAPPEEKDVVEYSKYFVYRRTGRDIPGK